MWANCGVHTAQPDIPILFSGRVPTLLLHFVFPIGCSSFSFESCQNTKYGIPICFQSGVRCRMGSPEVNGGSGGHSLPGQKRWLLKSSSQTNVLQFLSTLITLILITTMRRTIQWLNLFQKSFSIKQRICVGDQIGNFYVSVMLCFSVLWLLWQHISMMPW